VAIFNNNRDTPDAVQCGRLFCVMLEPTGEVVVEYHAMK